MSALLSIADITIHQDKDHRYCLNELHQASGGNNKHRPSLWLANEKTKELIDTFESEAGIPASLTLRGNRADKIPQGTYAVKELVYAYAMWISPKFHLHVIRAFDAQVKAASAPIEDNEFMVVMDATEFNRLLDDKLADLKQSLLPRVEPSALPLEGTVLLELRGGQMVSSQVLAKGSLVYDPRDPVSIRRLVRDYIPAPQLSTLLDVTMERMQALARGAQA